MRKQFLYLNSRDEFYRIDINKIVYFEADGNYTHFVLGNKLRGTVGGNLSQMQRVLSESLKEDASIFARVGKRFIINLNFVYHIDIRKQRLVISDGQTFAFQLPLSKESLRILRTIYIGKGHE